MYLKSARQRTRILSQYRKRKAAQSRVQNAKEELWAYSEFLVNYASVQPTAIKRRS